MNCSYTIKEGNKSKDLTLVQLTEHFYKTTSKLKNTKIFSSEEIIESTQKEIAEIFSKEYRETFLTKEEIRQGEIIDKNSYVGTRDFISTPNNNLINLGANSNRLAPEFILKNRIPNYIKQRYDRVSNVPSLPEDKELEEALKIPELSHIPRHAVNYYLVEIKNIIEFEEKVKDIGIGIHKVISAIISSGGNVTSELVKKSLDEIYTDNNKIILDKFSQDWRKEILNISEKIYEDLRARGSNILTEVFIASKAKANAKIKGNLDAIVIDENGIPHIYDFKVAKSKYEDWDSAKILTTDWQLALYRQLLGQFTDTYNSELNIVAIHIDESPNGYNINYKIKNRLEEEGTLQHFGSIQQLASKLIPEITKISYDPDKYKSLLDALELLIPDYKIRISSRATNWENILNSRISDWEKTGILSFYNELEVPGLKKGKIVIDPEKADKTRKTRDEMIEEITPIIKIYADFLKENDFIDLSRLKTTIAGVMSNPARDSLNYSTSLDNTLKSYLNGNYQIVKGSEELASLGLILFQNKFNGKIVVFSVSANNFKADYKDGLNYGDLEYVKVFAFLNEYYSDLNLDNKQIENIIVYNLSGDFPDPRPIHKKLELYLNLSKNRIKKPIKISNKNIVPIEIETASLIGGTLRAMSLTEKKSIEDVLGQNMLTASWEDLPLEKLKEAQKAMFEAFPNLRGENTLKPNMSFQNQIEYTYALLATLILQKSKYTIEGDFLDMTNFSSTFSDFKSVLSALYSPEQAQYNAAGQRILGIMGGLKVSTPDKISSRDLKNINEILKSANNRIAQLMYEQSTIIASHTKKYFNDIGYSTTSQNLWGYTRDKFKNLFITDETGEISDEWKVKNPYKYDLKNQMTDIEREYLKKMLFEIKKWELNLTDTEIKRIDISSLESIAKTGGSRILEAINSANENYFRIPLVRSEALDRNGAILHGGVKGIVQRSKNYLGELYDLIDPREFSEEDLKNSKEQQLGIFEMYDVYSRQTDGFKKEALKKFGKSHYELNLDTIAHRVAFSKLRKNQLDTKLPIINAFIWSMKLVAGKYSKDISNELQYVAERLKVAAFDEPIVGDEFKDVVTAVSVAKRFTTALMLGFRPVLMAKELTVGLFKGFSLASTQMFGKDLFTSADLAKALGKLMTIDNKFSLEWNLIDGINNYYAFANMDINTISKKLQTSRRGAALGIGRWMYMTSTLPDYYNRLSLFLAKMIHDGSYEAHSLNENGFIQYDPRKDMRFSYYLENRNKYKNSANIYYPAPNDLKYNTQRNMYLQLVSELNQDRAGEQNLYTEDSIVNQAYSGRERNSFKTLTDTAYGYYDKDSQSLLHNTAFGMIFMQFMQFWPGKMHMWFGKPTKNNLDPNESPMTRFVQKTRKDKDGKIIKIWRKTKYVNDNPEEGIEDIVETEEDTSDPWMVIEGSPQEGLMLSILYTVQDVIKGDWDKALSDKDRMNRVYFAMLDAAAMMVLFGIIVAIIKAWIAENGTEGLSGNTMQFLYEVDRRVLSEANVYNSTIGAVSSTPAFFSFGRQLAGDIADTLTGNAGIMQTLSSDVKAFELLDVN